MLLITAIVLAFFFVPAPWNAVVLAIGLVGEAGEVLFGIWYGRRRIALAGARTMVGATARVVEACCPNGRVSYKGERWIASCAEGAGVGERVRVGSLNGLTLVVERIDQ